MYASVRASDKRIACEEEFSDSEDEGEGGRKDRQTYKHKTKRPRTEEGEKKEADKGKIQVYGQTERDWLRWDTGVW